MNLSPSYPTRAHEDAANEITAFFTENYDVESVLLVNSCARGKACQDSCLDIVVLAKPDVLRGQASAWEAQYRAFEQSNPVIQKLWETGAHSVVHPDFTDGVFEPEERDEATGPDSFELEIGNFLAYSVPLWNGGDYLASLKDKWLPYYDETLRQQRLDMVRWHCLNNLHHIPGYLERGLFFQSFDRLYNAYQEFLQALFIARRTYPIAYNKWIHEQVVDILQLPELYTRLVRLFEIGRFESNELGDKAKEVEELLILYTGEGKSVG